MKNKYIDVCLTLQILKQDSGLLPAPKKGWNTFVPAVDDVAYILQEHCAYRFDGTQWIKIEKKEDTKHGRR